MVAPVLLGLHGGSTLSIPASITGLTLHVAAMLVVMGIVAVAVYERLGLRGLQRGVDQPRPAVGRGVRAARGLHAAGL
jgi:hypothetical protein